MLPLLDAYVVTKNDLLSFTDGQADRQRTLSFSAFTQAGGGENLGSLAGRMSGGWKMPPLYQRDTIKVSNTQLKPHYPGRMIASRSLYATERELVTIRLPWNTVYVQSGLRRGPYTPVPWQKMSRSASGYHQSSKWFPEESWSLRG